MHRWYPMLLIAIAVVAALTAPLPLIVPVTICAILGATAGSVIWSYAAWRQEQRT